MTRRLTTLITLVLFLTACGSLTPAPPHSQTPDTATSALTELPSVEAVEVYIAYRANQSDFSLLEEPFQLNLGDLLSLSIEFTPVRYTVYYSSGNPNPSTSYERLDSYTVAELQYCVSLNLACELGNQWSPFSERGDYLLTLDQLGEQTLFFQAHFRDSAGNAISAFGGDETGLHETISATRKIVSNYDPTTPIVALPEQVQASALATQTTWANATATAQAFIANNVTGSILLDGGSCCVGGIEGRAVTITAALQAASPFGQITHMRFGGLLVCTDPSQMTSEWEPFATEKTFEVNNIPINWTTFAVSVQFRDVTGNLSPIYCEDIAVEGMPAPPTL